MVHFLFLYIFTTIRNLKKKERKKKKEASSGAESSECEVFSRSNSAHNFLQSDRVTSSGSEDQLLLGKLRFHHPQLCNAGCLLPLVSLSVTGTDNSCVVRRTKCDDAVPSPGLGLQQVLNKSEPVLIST